VYVCYCVCSDTLNWYHTYSATLSGVSVQCNTGIQLFVAPPSGGTGTAGSPAPSAIGAGLNPQTAAFASPQSAIQALQAGASAGLNAPLPAAVICPAILFDRSILPMGNNMYTVSFTGNSATNPTATLQGLNL
jgi:hypothetical protein